MSKSLKAAKSIWNWRDSPANIQKIASSRHRRALIQCCIMLIIASVLIFMFDHLLIGIFIYSMAILVFIGGFFFAVIFNTIEFIGRILARGVGKGLTWILLVPFFYLVFLPGRIILKLFGKDPMKRIWERERNSYWVNHTNVTSPKYYRRQY